ncbi:hypothetical protein AC1031_010309 [Aphanomyces cochlioides]|nr:hypothetical protein AC1031_010309 [Aphanomyces cochlioides]
MMTRLKRYKANGVPYPIKQAEWILHRKTIETHVLTLPPLKLKNPGRKRVHVGARILSLTNLASVDATQEEKQAAAQRASELRAKGKNKERSRKPAKMARTESEKPTNLDDNHHQYHTAGLRAPLNVDYEIVRL